MTARFIFAIVSTLLEEAALVAIVFWGLPRFGIYIPLWGLVLLMIAWCAYSVYGYRIGSRALRRKPVAGLTAMIGSKGEVVKPLAPDGFIKIKGELWRAASADKNIKVGEEVVVMGQDGLRLIVSKNNTGDLEGSG